MREKYDYNEYKSVFEIFYSTAIQWTRKRLININKYQCYKVGIRLLRGSQPYTAPSLTQFNLHEYPPYDTCANISDPNLIRTHVECVNVYNKLSAIVSDECSDTTNDINTNHQNGDELTDLQHC